jgi:tetratricopeptide (TPR) repeat protein
MRLPGQPKDERELISARAQAWLLLGVIFFGFCLALWLGSVPLVVLGCAVALMWLFHYIFMTRVLMPTGDSTPGDKSLSHIDAMVARGDYQGAAAAFDREIQADPADYWSCERLAMLARRHLKDPELAVRALRQAEQRVPEPRRRAGYALLALGVLRDDLADQGRAIVELRRILSTYPDIPNAGALRAELEQMRADRFREP